MEVSQFGEYYDIGPVCTAECEDDNDCPVDDGYATICSDEYKVCVDIPYR
jgi:hypothetical protein